MLVPPPPRALTVITLPPVLGSPSPLHSPVPKLPLMCRACLPITSSPGACLFLRKGFLIFAAQGGMNSWVGTDT